MVMAKSCLDKLRYRDAPALAVTGRAHSAYSLHDAPYVVGYTWEQGAVTGYFDLDTGFQ